MQLGGRLRVQNVDIATEQLASQQPSPEILVSTERRIVHAELRPPLHRRVFLANDDGDWQVTVGGEPRRDGSEGHHGAAAQAWSMAARIASRTAGLVTSI